MKTMKKLFALLLALTMVFGLAATAFAATSTGNERENKGTITIENPAYNTTYNAYRLLDLESWDKTTENNGGVTEQHYAYKLNEDWCKFFGYEYAEGKYTAIEYNEGDEKPAGAGIFEADQYGVITKQDITAIGDVALFAKAALAWAEENADSDATFGPITEKEWTDDHSGDKFENQKMIFDSEADGEAKYEGPLGYYLVSTNLGALCSLNTTDADALIQEKNEVTHEKKEVKLPDGNYGSENTADIGDKVEFKVTIDAKEGAQGYVYHDLIDDTLDLVLDDLNDVKLTVKYMVSGGTSMKEFEVPADAEEGAYSWYQDNDGNPTWWSVEMDVEHEDDFPFGNESEGTCSFHIVFTQDFLDHVEDGQQIIIEYAAVINENATLTKIPNENRSILEYGDHHYTPESGTKTYTYQVNILKYTPGEEENRNPLGGAEFVLYKYDTDKTTKLYLQAEKDSKSGIYHPLNDNDGATPPTYTPNTHWKKAPTSGDAYTVESGKDKFNEDWEDLRLISDATTGYIKIDGLEPGTYHLKEIMAPNGYNQLNAEVVITIAETKDSGTPPKIDGGKVTWKMSDSTDAAVEAETVGTDEDAIKFVVPVENNTGIELPSTGGMGTTLFYIVGSLLVLGAAVTLVAKKRTNI